MRFIRALRRVDAIARARVAVRRRAPFPRGSVSFGVGYNTERASRKRIVAIDRSIVARARPPRARARRGTRRSATRVGRRVDDARPAARDRRRETGDARVRLFVSLAMMRIVVVVVAVASAARVERARASTIVDSSSDARSGWVAGTRMRGGSGRALRGTSDAEACRARAWATGVGAADGASTAEATCAAIGATSATRCEAAMASLKCRLERAGARARAEACDRESADDCERCVLRALGRGARGRGNRNDNDRDDAVEDEATFESDGAITLDRAVEFSMYVDETHAIDSDCKFLVSMFRAEMASRALDRKSVV